MGPALKESWNNITNVLGITGKIARASYIKRGDWFLFSLGTVPSQAVPLCLNLLCCFCHFTRCRNVLISLLREEENTAYEILKVVEVPVNVSSS